MSSTPTPPTPPPTPRAPPPHGSPQRHLDFERALLHQAQGWLTGSPSDTLRALHGLPLDAAGATQWLWAETPPRLQQMLARATLRWLTERGGWRKQPYPDADQVRQGRLWESPPFRALTLRFGAASPDIIAALTEALLAAERAALLPPSATAKRSRKPSPAEATLWRLRGILARRAPLTTPAEQLALALIAPAMLRQSAHSAPIVAEVVAAIPLARLLYSASAGAPECPPTARPDAQAWADAWGWTSPWLADAWATPWVEADADALTRGLLPFQRAVERLGVTLHHLIDVALDAECHAWLLPALSFFRRAYAADPAARLSTLATLTRSQRVADRQVIQDTWGHLLRAMERLNQARLTIQRTLPADREPHARAFITFWQAHDMTATAERSQTLRATLERVLG